MTRPLLTIAPDDLLDTAARLMEKHGVHHLLVIERDRMAGILSSADLLKLALLLPEEGHQSSVLEFRVRDLMQSRVAVLRENTSLKDAARALSLGGFHAVPVLALDDTPVGIVTSSDLMGLLIEQIGHDSSAGTAHDSAQRNPQTAAESHLLEVLRAAEIYLRSGHSDQQHARLIRAVSIAREALVKPVNARTPAC